MLRKIARGGRFNLVCHERAEEYLRNIKSTIEQVKLRKKRGLFYGYKQYLSLDGEILAFYVVKVTDAPYGLLISVRADKQNATILRMFPYSTDNIRRILNGKQVEITRDKSCKYNYWCRFDNRFTTLERFYELRQRRLRRERLLERRLRYLERLEYLERLRRLRRLYGS